jgi:phosphoribosylanthranilate isomerase
MKIKVCGNGNRNSMLEIDALLPDFMGYIFYKNSARYVFKHQDEENFEKQLLDLETPKVAVFVNEELGEVEKIARKYFISHLQLHGNETVDYCQKLKSKGYFIIKAFGIDDFFDWSILNSFEDSVDIFLFDTKTNLHGGSGQKFDWKLLDNYTCDIPFFISGGIALDDIDNIINLKHPKLYGIDINSKFESFPCIKDKDAVREAIKKIRKYE